MELRPGAGPHHRGIDDGVLNGTGGPAPRRFAHRVWPAALASAIAVAGSAPESHVSAHGRGDSGAAAVGPSIAADTVLGRRIYVDTCQVCHQASGRGLPGAFPPVVGSDWSTGPAATVVRIILDGLEGPILVAGAMYNLPMPGWREQLTDEQVAAVTTYIRQWGENDAGPVTADSVASVRAATADRKRPWTAPELRPPRP
jgi:mono/diheme cytochrome c family protein